MIVQSSYQILFSLSSFFFICQTFGEKTSRERTWAALTAVLEELLSMLISKCLFICWTFGENACHPSLRSGSGSTDAQILRCAQDDSQDPAHVRSREVFSPNVCSSVAGLLKRRSDWRQAPHPR